jgi:uncharacterized DUF497 family protein
VILEWDREKGASNLAKHGVDFHEAGTVFDDPLATTFPDPTHSVDEQRYVTIGLSLARRILARLYHPRAAKEALSRSGCGCGELDVV